ncbi:hypothetical protein C5E45_23275 [Nocardia nova]|uniref:AMP-dependent synthetase/ligase domain-containing protein n=1 Tax=Nocardia nova TaxID=37330 RepID=A0A2S6AKK7_9NOCA|nr:AMP-binding protein [Nocardia nova]PPJ22298.1 hypothetical protein C5E41_27475 [Nocardia nova]PPJ35760.1 hypothetical protein C5E45_23275 [Nocardia nova]
MTNRAAESLVPGSFATTPESYPDHAISDIVRIWAQRIAHQAAFVTTGGSTSWSEYDRSADAICAALRATPGGPRSRVALLLPDTAAVHAALCGCYRAGRVAAAVGVRSGVREIAHVMRRTAASTLVTAPEIRGRTWQALVRELDAEGVVCSVVPAPYGFGLWSAHFLPALLGLDAPGLSSRLASRGVTKEYTPEYVVAVDRLRLGPGGKTDRGVARDTAMRMLGLR